MLFDLLDKMMPMDLSNIVVSYLSYHDIIIMLPEIHRIYTTNIDDYNLSVPYHTFRNTIWEWRYLTFHNPGIRMKAHSVLGGNECTYPWEIGPFLPPSHGRCAIGFRDIIVGDGVTDSDLTFIMTHWGQDLFRYMADSVMDKDGVNCLRSGCGVVLGLILREIREPLLYDLSAWTDNALRGYDNDHFRRCVYTETDNLFPKSD